jgi:hypothetical protein
MRCGALVGGLQQAVPAPLVDEQQKSRPIAAHRCTAPNKRHAAASPVAQHSAHDGARARQLALSSARGGERTMRRLVVHGGGVGRGVRAPRTRQRAPPAACPGVSILTRFRKI